MYLTEETIRKLGPREGKLYRVNNPLGVKVAYLDNTGNVELSYKDIFMVGKSELIADAPKKHWAFSFTIIMGEKLFDNLLAFPVWFDHNFALIQ